MERESFVFYKSFYEASKFLSVEDKGKLFDMVCQYALYGEDVEIEGPAMGMFLLIKPQLDANNRRYENGCKGGAPEGNKNAVKTWGSISKQPKNNQTTTKKQPNDNQKQPNDNDNDNVNVNENANNNDNVNVNENANDNGDRNENEVNKLPANAGRETVEKKNNKYDVMSMIHTDNETEEEGIELNEARKAYKEMRKKIKKPLTEYAEKLRAKDLVKLGDTTKERIAILNQSIASGWQDLYELKDKPKQKLKGNMYH